MRRFTRLTNAFSKKVENLGHAVALHFVYYNFCRRHMTLGMTPAMAAGLSDHEWSIEELVGLLEAREMPTSHQGETGGCPIGETDSSADAQSSRNSN